MDLDKVLDLFDDIGNNVFAKPRLPLLPRRFKWLVHRYSDKSMRRVIEQALDQRDGHVSDPNSQPLRNSNYTTTRVSVNITIPVSL
jgi:hypothetical protein